MTRPQAQALRLKNQITSGLVKEARAFIMQAGKVGRGKRRGLAGLPASSGWLRGSQRLPCCYGWPWHPVDVAGILLLSQRHTGRKSARYCHHPGCRTGKHQVAQQAAAQQQGLDCRSSQHAKSYVPAPAIV